MAARTKSTAEVNLPATETAREQRALFLDTDPQGTPHTGIDAGRFDTVTVDALPPLGLADEVELWQEQGEDAPSRDDGGN
ncbi:hypothetical protein [Nonomuraea sp. NPDC049709]|uniref:hypothetical protein n=1 Tax=Nonomuraea sp. NPDC049709 TaxID=3154736 RepID=UPI0034371B1E